MTRVRIGCLLLAALLLIGAGGRTAAAEGANLDGLMAPEMTFPAGLNGVAAGTTLSSMRGRVVWVKFWLRDCPHCRKTLPAAQEMHELYGGSGLVVLTVVHQHGPDQVQPFLKQQGYTFPVASDPTGALAQLYQVGRRPADYVVDHKGRVRVSNSAAEDVILTLLAEQRVAELGRVPAGMEGVKQSVQAWDYGAALRQASAAAGAADASVEVRDLAARVEALAARRLPADIERARVLWRRNRLDEAAKLFQRLAAGYEGSKHADVAAAALSEFQAAQPR